MPLTFKTVAMLFITTLALCFNTYSAEGPIELMPGLTKDVLPNGMTLLVKENHSSKVTAVQIWVKAGSAFEKSHEAGLTHLIEHMIFKGTPTNGPGELASAIESMGGSINAYTSLDYTVYHCVVPSEHTKKAIQMLSDAVLNSSFDPEELEREKKVVFEEMRMRNDRPASRLWELAMKTSYTVYPYRLPVIGSHDSVAPFTREDILTYMKRRYRPCQMSAVVVGDVDSNATLNQLNRIFSAIEKAPEDKMTFPQETKQEDVRYSSETMDIEEAHMAVTFSGIPDFNSPWTPTLDVMAAIMGTGYSSRLVYSLKERDRLVHSIDAAAFTPRGPGLFEISVTLDPDNTEKALSGILIEIFRLTLEPVLDEELERAKTKVIANFTYSQETMEGEARKLGVFETLTGNPINTTLYIQKVKNVSKRDILEAAQRFFRTKNINIATVMPETKQHDITQELAKQIINNTFESIETGMEIFPSHVKEHPVVSLDLPNGLKVLMRQAPELPVISLSLVFPGGLRYENPETNGIFNFMTTTWTRGTDNHNALELAEMIEDTGGSVTGFSGQNSFGLKGRFLKDHFDKGLDLFTEIATDPSFPEDEVEKLTPLLQAAIKRQNDNITGVAVREFRKLLFEPSPYSMNPLGTTETVASFTSKNLADTYMKYAIAERAILAISGDINPDTLSEKLLSKLGKWRSSERAIPKPPAEPDPLKGPKYGTILRDKQQSHIVLGFRGSSMNSPDRYPLDVLNAVLAGMGGRLFSTLRDEESLAYSVTSFVSPGIEYGAFAFYLACAPEKKNQAQKALWREIYRIRTKGITEAELSRAINWLSGREETGLQTNSSRAMDMALHELYGLGYNFSEGYVQKIKTVTVEQVDMAAQKFLTPDSYILVIAGP